MPEYIRYTIAALLFLFFCGLSFFIWQKKMLFLIAGYQEGQVQEKSKLARYYGIFFFIIGIESIFLPFSQNTTQIFMWLGILVFSVIAGGVFINLKVR
ncbi:DUF3784 domain-containing protein (plasmid) [Arthrobacter citreus]|nr:DUF3784 domain-containing protein [Arthrobacter citreus]